MSVWFMGKGKLLITESLDFSANAIKRLGKHYDVIVKDIQDEHELLAHIQDVEVLFVRLKFMISKEIIDAAAHLKFILTATTGLDHIDVDYFETKGGKVISLRGANEFLETIPSTAEHTWGLILALVRNLPKAFEDVKQGHWDRDRFKGHNLKALKLGILGLGRIGKQIESYAKAFGMEIGFFDINSSINSEISMKFSSAEQLFEWADVLTVHIPLDTTTTKFLDMTLLRHLKPSAYLINTSRGAVIDTSALEVLLKQKRLAGYATDVLAKEILDEIENDPLVVLAKQGYNIIITPHIAGCTYESMNMTEDFIANRLISIF